MNAYVYIYNDPYQTYRDVRVFKDEQDRDRWLSSNPKKPGLTYETISEAKAQELIAFGAIVFRYEGAEPVPETDLMREMEDYEEHDEYERIMDDIDPYAYGY